MKELIHKIKRSEFLTLNELLRVKVSLVMIFLLLIGLLTVPVSFFEDFALTIRIIVPSIFVLLFSFTFLMLILRKSRIAMHFSIYTFLGLTVYYVDGSGQLYGYFLLFITLTVIIFYQDITTYILYGGVLTAYGVYFIQTNEELVAGLPENLQTVSPIIYQFILIGFFVVYLLQFILTDSFNENLNEEYLKTSKANDLFQTYVIKYIGELQDRNGVTRTTESEAFQEKVKKVAGLIGENVPKPPQDIEEVVEYYFFIQKEELQRVVESENASKRAIRYAKAFEKYRLNHPNDLNNLYFATYFSFKPNLKVDINRYERKLDKMFTNNTNKILAFAIIYLVLNNQITRLDRWGRVNKILTHDEIMTLIQSKGYREYLSFEDINFILQNQDIFENYL